MKRLLSLLIFFFLPFLTKGQNTPFVIENLSNGNPDQQYVRTNSSMSAGYYGVLGIGQELVAKGITQGGNAPEPLNSTSTSYWYEVDLPGPNNPVMGYMAAGSMFSVPQCSGSYFTITHPTMYVRSSSALGSSNYVTYSGNPVYVYNNQIYPLINTIQDPSDNITWYEIDLPSGYSNTIGYVAGIVNGNQWVSVNTTPTQALPTPNLSASNITTNSVDLNWVMNYEPSGNTNTSFVILNQTTNSTNNFTPVPNAANTSNYTVTGLSPGTSYTFVVQANFNGCSSSYSNPVTITTTASQSCTYSASPSGSTNYTSSGGSGMINVTAENTCQWTASTSDSWINITSGSPGTGNETVNYNVIPNGNSNPLNGTITISGQSFTQSIPISEAASTPTSNPSISLSGNLSFGNVTVGSTSSPETMTITNNGNAPLNVSSINYPNGFSGDWNGGTIPANGGSQNVNVTFSPTAATSYNGTVTINSNATSGTSSINCSGTGTQSNAPLSARFTLSQTSISQGGTITATSTSTGNPTTYAWTSNPSSGVSFSNPTSANTNITFTNTGTYNINLQVGNGSSYSQASGQPVTVSASSNSCTYSVSPTGSTNYPVSGGSGSINVTAGSSCTWSATSNVSWISLQNASGTENGTVTYTVQQNNTSPNPLSGNITIAGQTVTITQAGTVTQNGTAPVAGFTLSSSTITQGGTVTATNTSTGNPTSYLWWTSAPPGDASFSPNGSGTSTDQSPTITFNTAGTYMVYLMVTNATGSNSTSQQVTVSAIAGCSYSLSPRSNTNAPAGEGSYNLTVNTSSGNNCTWTATSNNSWITITSGSSGTGNGMVGYHITSFTGSNPRHGSISIGGQNFAITQAGVPVPASISIDESATVIPPWQREGDDFTVNITISNSAQFKPWKFEIFRNGGSTPINVFDVNSGNTQSFNSTAFNSDPEAPLSQGDDLSYIVAYQDNSSSYKIKQHTTIIEKKWDEKNEVYYNTPSNQLEIPLEYIPGTSSINYSFSRVPLTSTADNSDNIVNGGSGVILSNEIDRYIYLNGNNSNIETVTPGVFNYQITYLPSGISESGEFDLTKIGNVNNILGSTNFDPNKVVILIAGLNDNIERAIDKLANTTSDVNEAPWSIANALAFGQLAPDKTNYNTWYIGASNVNAIQRNAYDIGISIDTILSILQKPPFNSLNPDLSIIAHSKAGLETRVMLGGQGVSLSTPEGFDPNITGYYDPLHLSPFLHSIVFLGVPNLGATSANYEFLLGFQDDCFTCEIAPGVTDLLPNSSSVINYLTTKATIPPEFNLRIANITGYDSPWGNGDALVDIIHQLSPLFKIKGISIHLPFLPGDGAVSFHSSKQSDITPNGGVSLYQYYIRDDIPVDEQAENLSEFVNNSKVLGDTKLNLSDAFNLVNGKILHTYLPRLYTLTDASNTCITYGYTSNLISKEITPIIANSLEFFLTFDDKNITFTPNGTISLLTRISSIINNENIQASCQKPILLVFHTTVVSSVLSNATISLYYPNQNSYIPVTKTDENGMGSIYFYDYIPLGDTILITSPGIVPLKFTFDSAMLNTKSFVAAMFHKQGSDVISEPKLSLLNQEPISSSDNVTFEVGGTNVKQYEINTPINQDSIFVPLNLNNNQFSVHLDTGINTILVRFIGNQNDTVVLGKNVYYLPDSLMNELAMNLQINTPANLIGAKAFVNNVFYQNVTSGNTDLKIFAGTNQVKFSRFGYIDTVITIDTDSTIQLNMQPYSYSSLSDSNTIDFSDGLNPQYWKNITVMNMDSTSPGKISLKQYDDSFSNLGLQPETRTFELRNLSNTTAHLKAAMALDQANTPDSSEVYLLSIHDGIYTKYQANIPNLTEYDPEVQKIEFDSVQIAPGGTEQLVLMKKLAPIMPAQALKYPSGRVQKIPLSLFAQDPDSIPHDMQVTARILSAPAGMETYLDSNSLHVISPPGDSGDIILQVTATHDFISMTKDYDIKIAPPTLMKDNMILYPNPASNNLNIVVEVASKFQLTSLTIYNLWGQVIKTVVNDHPLYQGYHVFTVPLGYLPAGIYFVEWRGVITKKFIKYSESE